MSTCLWLMRNSWTYLTFMTLLAHYSSSATLLMQSHATCFFSCPQLVEWREILTFMYHNSYPVYTKMLINPHGTGKEWWNYDVRGIPVEGMDRDLQQKAEGKAVRQTEKMKRSKERSGGGLRGQRETETQDRSLSFQRERKQTASAERNETQSRTAWSKVHRQPVQHHGIQSSAWLLLLPTSIIIIITLLYIICVFECCISVCTKSLHWAQRWFPVTGTN